jgi:phosphoglycerate dehydrogenase-like enzyme
MRRAVLNMRDERAVWTPPAWVASRLRDALPAADWELIDVEAPVSGRGDGGGLSAEAVNAVRGAEIYFGLGLPRALLQTALTPPARLRWVHTGTAGVASLLHPELREHDVTLTNSAGTHGPAMAETVIGMMLHFVRGLDHAVRAQQRREWSAHIYERADSGVREIAGATIGIIGYGGIGREVAKRAAALGMRVLAMRRHASPDVVAEIVTGNNALAQLLSASDVVVLTVPSTNETRGMIGPRELALMRTDAVLINVSRGDVIDERAMTDALRSGRLRGAALDVFTAEPLPPESPLWQMENVLITPHVSATTPRFWERETELILDNLQRYLAGTPLRNIVSASDGY